MMAVSPEEEIILHILKEHCQASMDVFCLSEENKTFLGTAQGKEKMLQTIQKIYNM